MIDPKLAALAVEIQKELRCRDYTAEYLAALVLREPTEPAGAPTGTKPDPRAAQSLEASIKGFEAWQKGGIEMLHYTDCASISDLTPSICDICRMTGTAQDCSLCQELNDRRSPPQDRR